MVFIYSSSILNIYTKYGDIMKVEFIASFPDILSAISVAGQDSNSRIKLDIPASDIGAVIKLIAMKKRQTFKVTIEKIEGEW